jgi:hypothetical protein
LFRQLLGRGVHGTLLCQAGTAGAGRVFAAGRTFGVTFFGSTTSETVGAKRDEGVQNIGGRSEEVARPGRAYSARVRTARPERP